MKYASLCADEIAPDLLAVLDRRQRVTRCWRRAEGHWEVRDVPFIDDWTPEERAAISSEARDIARRGGLVLAARGEDGALVGLATVAPELFGSAKQYIDLCLIVVSRPYRGQGVGRALFERACAFALSRGARRLYISAHSSVESVAFYHAMGCEDAREPSEKHVALEPCDRQMERALTADKPHDIL